MSMTEFDAPVTTLVVSRNGFNDWRVEDNNGAEDGGFKNWVKAMDFAREVAVGCGAEIVRLSAKSNAIVERVSPRVKHARKALSVNADVVAPAATNLDDILAQVGAINFTADELRNMPAPKLLALFNETTGGAATVLKRGRAVAAILAA